jgi:hypothetical protein
MRDASRWEKVLDSSISGTEITVLKSQYCHGTVRANTYDLLDDQSDD